jgi:two-component system response regulator PhoP
VHTLVVEDETELRERLRSYLHDKGYVVDVAADGEEGLYYGEQYPVDLAVIDIGLPKLSGLELIRRLRSQGKRFPILILTARGHWQDKVEGLESGADDYLVKPFRFEELQARLNALDTHHQSVSVGGKPVELTAFEYKVLECLMLRAGQVVSKAQLTENIYDQDFDRDSNVLEVFVGRLRRKLDPESSIKPIETLRGRGYRFSLPPEGH